MHNDHPNKIHANDTNAEPEISNYLFIHISLGLGYGRGMLVMDMNILIDIDMTGSLTWH